MAFLEDSLKKTRAVGDRLQSYAFHLVDISPSARAPFWTLHQLNGAGFTTCSAPSYTVETEAIGQINSRHKMHYAKSLECGSITLTRGVSAYDSSMYRWLMRSSMGEDYTHRNLVLIHFMGFSPYDQAVLNNNVYGMVRLFGKAYVLYNCLVTSYNAGSDFDATSGEVSIAELEIQPEYFSEVSLDPLQLTDLTTGGNF